MSGSFTNVALVGANGSLGAAILKELSARPHIKVRVLSRSAGRTHGIETTPVNYDDADALVAALKGVDAVISLVGHEAWRSQTKVIDAAIAAGVRRFLPSEYGADTTVPASQEIQLIASFGKLDVERYLEAREDVIEHTYVYTGIFWDWALDNGFMGVELGRHAAELWDGGEGAVSGTTVAGIAAGVVGVLEHPVETRNRGVRVASLTTSLADLVAEAERQAGRNFDVKAETRAHVRQLADALISKGDLLGFFLDLRLRITTGSSVCNWATDNDNALLGVPEATLEEIVRGSTATLAASRA